MLLLFCLVVYTVRVVAVTVTGTAYGFVDFTMLDVLYFSGLRSYKVWAISHASIALLP